MATLAGCPNAFAYLDILFSFTVNSSVFAKPMLNIYRNITIYILIIKIYFSLREFIRSTTPVEMATIAEDRAILKSLLILPLSWK